MKRAPYPLGNAPWIDGRTRAGRAQRAKELAWAKEHACSACGVVHPTSVPCFPPGLLARNTARRIASAPVVNLAEYRRAVGKPSRAT